MENNSTENAIPNPESQPQTPVNMAPENTTNTNVEIEPIKKGNKNKYLIIGLVLILLLGLIGGGYYFGQNYKITPKSAGVEVEETSSSPTPMAIGDETAGWITYTNDTFNYTVGYPKDWKQDICLYCEKSSPIFASNAAFFSPNLETNPIPVVLKGGYITISGFNQKYNGVKKVEEFCKSNPPINVVEKCEETVVGGKKAFKKTFKNHDLVLVTIFENDEGIIDLRAEYQKDNKGEILEVFEKMLSTFKFTKNEDVSGWVEKNSDFKNYTDFENALNKKEGGIFASLTANFDTNKLSVCKTFEEQVCIIPGKDWGQKQDLEKTTVDGIEAISFFVNHKKSSSVIHVIHTNNPFVEIATAVDGAGLEGEFQKFLKGINF